MSTRDSRRPSIRAIAVYYAKHSIGIEDCHSLLRPGARVILALRMRHCSNCRHLAEVTLGNFEQRTDPLFTPTAAPIVLTGNVVRVLLQ